MAHLELNFELDDNQELAGVRYVMDTPEGIANGVFVQALATAVVGILSNITPDEETFDHAIDLFNEHANRCVENTRAEDTPTEEES